MSGVIGEILPHAIGIAISPMPIIAAILMLLSRRAKETGIGFLIGWIVGVFAATLVFSIVAAAISTSAPSGGRPGFAVVQIVLGALLLLLAVRQWRKRPRNGEDAALPKWMAAIDRIRFVTALGLGILLSAVNPKNLLLAAGAGILIGSATLSVGQTFGTIAVFTAVASLTIAGPVIAFLFASARLQAPLQRLHAWLARENAVIMSIVFVVLAAVLIGKGIANLS